MKKLILVLLLVWALIQPAEAGNLIGTQIVDTGSFSCNGSSIQFTPFENTFTYPLYIRRMSGWMGMDKGGVADFWYGVTLNQTSWVAWNGWDHYTDPTGFHKDNYELAPDYIALQPSDKLYLHAGCNSTTPNNHGHVVFYIWYAVTK